MYDPWRSFQRQPWLPLAKVASLTIVASFLLDYLFFWGLNYPLIRSIFQFVNVPSIATLSIILVTVGFGYLAVYLCEIWQPQVYLNRASLWALVLCLIMALWLKSLLPVAQFWLSLSFPSIVMITVGVFWRGRQFWRY
jgi:hypothetical protein